MIRLVLVRHGESTWNRENEFTGWTDVPLTEKGVEEARDAGKILRAAGFLFDVAHTSLLQRAIKTLWLLLEEMELMWIPVEKSWRLNERHYGSLQGMHKKEMTQLFGEQEVRLWRRSWDVAPPRLDAEDKRHPRHDPRYDGLADAELPASESLKECTARVLPYWNERILPQLKAGKEVLIAAHGNSLRALVKHLDGVSDEEIAGLNIPMGVPLVYELDDNLQPTRHYYLGDQEEIGKEIEAVKNQAK